MFRTRQRRLIQSNQVVERPLTQLFQLTVDIMDDGARKKMAKRAMIIGEILSTEQSYLATLHDIRRLFVQPLRESAVSGTPILTNKQIGEIFSNLEDIVKITTELYSALLAECQQGEDLSANARVGQIFTAFIPFMKMYSAYVKNYQTAIERVTELERKSTEFRHFLNNCYKSRECRGLSFQAFVLAPVQRIPRYKLLLEDLLKNTPETHVDYADLKKSLDQIESVATFVNETIREQESVLKMLSIQRNMSGLTQDLIQPGRRLLKQGILVKICRKTNKPRVLFLFSDILIYAAMSRTKASVAAVSNFASSRFVSGIGSMPSQSSSAFSTDTGSPASSGASFIFHRQFELEGMKIVDVKDSPLMRNCFQVQTTEKSFALLCQSELDKQQWMNALESAIDQLKRNKRTLKLAADQQESENQPPKPKPVGREDSLGELERAPVWVPDNATLNCMECNSPFGLIRRRHHCRSCGRVLCAQCTTKKTVLPSKVAVNEKRMSFSNLAWTNLVQNVPLARVCDPCHTIIDAKLYHLKQKMGHDEVVDMRRPMSLERASTVTRESADAVETMRADYVSDSDEDENEATTEDGFIKLFTNPLRIMKKSIGAEDKRLSSSVPVSIPSTPTPPRATEDELKERMSPRSYAFSDMHKSTRPDSQHSGTSNQNEKDSDKENSASTEPQESECIEWKRRQSIAAAAMHYHVSRTVPFSYTEPRRQSRSMRQFANKAFTLPRKKAISCDTATETRDRVGSFTSPADSGNVVPSPILECRDRVGSFTSLVDSNTVIAHEVDASEAPDVVPSAPSRRRSLSSYLDHTHNASHAESIVPPSSPPPLLDIVGVSTAPPCSPQLQTPSEKRKSVFPWRLSRSSTVPEKPEILIILRSGFLMKRGTRFKSWKYRFMVLTESELVWLKPEASAYLSATNTVKRSDPNWMNSLDLRDCTEISPVEPREEVSVPKDLLATGGDDLTDFDVMDAELSSLFPFKVTTHQRRLYMVARTAEERDDWIIALMDAASQCKSQKYQLRSLPTPTEEAGPFIADYIVESEKESISSPQPQITKDQSAPVIDIQVEITTEPPMDPPSSPLMPPEPNPQALVAPAPPNDFLIPPCPSRTASFAE